MNSIWPRHLQCLLSLQLLCSLGSATWVPSSRTLHGLCPLLGAPCHQMHQVSNVTYFPDKYLRNTRVPSTHHLPSTEIICLVLPTLHVGDEVTETQRGHTGGPRSPAADQEASPGRLDQKPMMVLFSLPPAPLCAWGIAQPTPSPGQTQGPWVIQLSQSVQSITSH